MRVSVIMSVHNGAKFLNRAVESILNQSIQDFEFIICDDASTDDTYEKLVEYKNQDSRFTIIQNEKNQQMFGEGNR
jgi:glycosyltransferase EpsE